MSKLRCWPGCYAIIQGGYTPFRGIVVKCISIAPDFAHDPHWDTEPELFMPGYRLSAAIADDTLVPINPPDGGITTEEVKELFSPSPAKESEKV